MRDGVRNPKQWLRGDGLPPDRVTPWELLLFAVSQAFKEMSNGFTGKQDFLYKEVYKVPAKYLSVAGTFSSIWDAINDPFLGAWMDKKRFGPPTLKTIMRVYAVFCNSFNVIKLIDGGLSPLQHVALLMFCNMSLDILGTLNGVADQKIRSGISPLTQERSRVRVWSNLGGQATWIIANLPTLLMGFSDVFGFSDYQIIFIGASILLPFAIISSILPTFVKQRVDYSRPSPLVMGEGEGHPSEEKRTLRQSFAIIRHNRYFIFESIANLITVFSPNASDELLIYRYLVPAFNVFGKEMSGEGVLLLKQTISGFPSTVMQPFNRQIINKLGGPLKAKQLKSAIDAGGKLLQFFVGYDSAPKLATMIATETAINAAVNWDGVAGEMLDYEFYDYVELKTGERSEGVTSAINGLFRKIITDNIGRVTSNAFLTWSGYTGGYKESGTLPPERYMKWIWSIYTLVPVIDNLVYIICRSFVKWTPADRERTEKELAERRKERAQMEEKAESAPVTTE